MSEARYVFYRLAPQEVGKRVTHRIERMGNFKFTLPQIRETFARIKSLKHLNVGWVPSGILRLPEAKVEQDLIRGLWTLIQPQPVEFGDTRYLKLSPLEGLEEGVVYISGCYRSQTDARMRSYDKGELVVVHYRGKRLSLSGDKPAPYRVDLWSQDDIWGLKAWRGGKRRIT